MNSFKDKTAVVTGGGSGIGRAICLVLAGRGCNVVVSDLDEAAAESVASAVREKRVRAHSVRADVARYEDVEALAEQAWAEFGQVDFLFNNAGVIVTGPFLEEDPRTLPWLLSVNVLGVRNGMHVFGRRFRDQGTKAHICNTGSEHSICVPSLGGGSYAASKHAMFALSDVFRREAPPNIGVSILCPGIVDTNLWSAAGRRPDDFGGPIPGPEIMKTVIGLGMDPMQVAERAVEGVERGDFYIVTHPHDRQYVEERYRELLAAFDAQAPWNPEAARYDVNEIARSLSAGTDSPAG